MGLVADDGDIAAVFRVQVKALGELARVVVGLDTGDLDAQGVDEEQARGEIVGRLAGAREGTVPDMGGTKYAAGAQETGEPGHLGAAARAERARRILIPRKGVGMAHEVEKHGDD